MLENEIVGGAWLAVEVGEGGHVGEASGLMQDLEWWQVVIPEASFGDVAGVIIFASLGSAVSHQMLPAG